MKNTEKTATTPKRRGKSNKDNTGSIINSAASDANTTFTMEELNKSFYGNSALREMLTNSLFCGHLCHAYLLYGQAGTNTTAVALGFAMAFQCLGDSSADNKPCGVCKSCKKALACNHPDIKICEGAGVNGAFLIEQIREIRQDIYIRPNESDYKIYIFKDAHKMNISAANAMLKVFEEPPAHVIFILTADSKTNMIDTIVSRCVSFEVFALPEYFNKTVFSAEASEVAFAFCNRDEYTLLCKLHKANVSREAMQNLISQLGEIFRAACVVKLSVMKSQNDVVTTLAQKMTMESLLAAIDTLAPAKAAIESNVNMGLLESSMTIELLSCVKEQLKNKLSI